MIGFNHALVGGLLAKYLPWPVALPLAFASHFALDTLPHYGIPNHHRDHSVFWKTFFTLDFFATFGLAAWAVYYQHHAMFFGGLVAVMPDFLWVAHVVRNRSFSLSAHKTRFELWHMRIQTREFANGIWIELPIAGVLFCIVILKTR